VTGGGASPAVACAQRNLQQQTARSSVVQHSVGSWDAFLTARRSLYMCLKVLVIIIHVLFSRF